MLDNIERDIKAAMLAGDKAKVETLRGLKSAILNEAIATGVKEEGLSDEAAQKVLVRESKKRSEAAELYKQGGNDQRAEAELAEKAIIDSYLPEQASEDEILAAVAAELAIIEHPSMQDMGKIVGAVRGRLGAGANGATIARLVKQAIESK